MIIFFHLPYINSEQNLRPVLDEEIREIQIENRFDRSKKTSINAFGNAKIIDRYGAKRTATAEWGRFRKEGESSTFLSGSLKYSSSSKWYSLNLDDLGR